MVERDGTDAITAAWSRELPGLPVEAVGVVSRVWRLAKLLGDQRRRIITEGDADQATLDLLAVLRRAGDPYELSPGEIARCALVTAGAISQRLARAEQAGLVERRTVPGARRRVVRLLPAGHELVDRLVGRIADLDADLLSALDDDQRDALDGLLRVVLADVERRFGAPRVPQVGAGERNYGKSRPTTPVA